MHKHTRKVVIKEEQDLAFKHCFINIYEEKKSKTEQEYDTPRFVFYLFEMGIMRNVDITNTYTNHFEQNTTISLLSSLKLVNEIPKVTTKKEFKY